MSKIEDHKINQDKSRSKNTGWGKKLIETSIFVKTSVSPPESSLLSDRTLHSDIPVTKYAKVFPSPSNSLRQHLGVLQFISLETLSAPILRAPSPQH